MTAIIQQWTFDGDDQVLTKETKVTVDNVDQEPNGTTTIYCTDNEGNTWSIVLKDTGYNKLLQPEQVPPFNNPD